MKKVKLFLVRPSKSKQNQPQPGHENSRNVDDFDWNFTLEIVFCIAKLCHGLILVLVVTPSIGYIRIIL